MDISKTLDQIKAGSTPFDNEERIKFGVVLHTAPTTHFRVIATEQAINDILEPMAKALNVRVSVYGFPITDPDNLPDWEFNWEKPQPKTDAGERITLDDDSDDETEPVGRVLVTTAEADIFDDDAERLARELDMDRTITCESCNRDYAHDDEHDCPDAYESAFSDYDRNPTLR